MFEAGHDLGTPHLRNVLLERFNHFTVQARHALCTPLFKHVTFQARHV